MEESKQEIKGKLETINSLTRYQLNMNKLIVIVQGEKVMFTVTRATPSKLPDCKRPPPPNFLMTYLQSRTETDNLAPNVRNVQRFTSIH